MNIIQLMYDLAYWFDYGTYVVLHHPFISLTTMAGALLFHQALAGMKLITGVITFAVAAVTALFLDWLIF
ncbi:MAG TPA: hypothetical protein VE131_10090 [Terriglobales bacterium]|nr:hypothetical protein [Terriglobales bacterium]